MLMTIKSFSGTIPRIGTRLLNTNQATLAQNAKFWSGELRPLLEDRAIKKVTPLSDLVQALYRYDHPIHGDIWLQNTEKLSYVKGPVHADVKNRTYVTGLDTPRVFNSDLILDTTETLTASNTYPLAVSKPTQTATIAVSGTGAGDPEARAYLYTYVRQWDTEKLDESAPSSPAETAGGELTVSVETDQTVTMSGIADTDRSDITHIVIYRTSTGSTAASYNKVIKFNLEDARAGAVSGVTYSAGTQSFTFADDILTEDLSSALVSLDWDAPLDELEGLVSLNNGILAGYVGNDVYLSAAYQPHAWPAKYRQTLDYPVKGLGHFGNTLVILTEAYPLLLTVATPDTAVLTPINEKAPCVSADSIVNTGDSVYYASTNGIIQVSSSGVILATQQLYSKEEWQSLRPETLRSALFEGRYYGFYSPEEGTTSSLVIDFAEANAGVSTLSDYFEAYYIEAETNTLYYLKRREDGSAYVWELAGNRIAHKNYVWRSKKFISSIGPVSLSAARVLGELPYVDPRINKEQELADNLLIFGEGDLMGALNEVPIAVYTIGGDGLTDLASKYDSAYSVLFRLYVDGQIYHEELVSTNKPFRLPSGLRGTEFQCELAGNINVFQVDMATSMTEIPS